MRGVVVVASIAIAACGASGRSFTDARGVADGRPVRVVASPAGEAPDEEFRAKPPMPLERRPRGDKGPSLLRLSNGIQVVAMERHDFPSVSIAMVLDRGADDAPPAVAAVYASALSGSSAAYDARDAWEYLRYFGVTVRTGVYPDAILLQATSLTPLWGSALSRVAPMFVKPGLGSKDLDDARTRISVERAEELEDPQSGASTRVLAALYPPPDPRGVPVRGKSADLPRSVGQGAVESFRDMFVSADRITLAAVGDFKTPQLERGLERAFGAVPRRRTSQADLPQAKPREATLIIVDRPGAAQSNVATAWLGPAAGDKDVTALEVLAAAVGQGLSSRLNLTVRKELGATYGVHMGVSARRDGGSVVVTAAIETPRTADALKKLLAELARLQREPITRDELWSAKSRTAYEVDEGSNPGLARLFAHALAEGLPPSWVTLRNTRIDALSADDLRAVADRWLAPTNVQIVVVGDATRIEADLRALGVARVEVQRN